MSLRFEWQTFGTPFEPVPYGSAWRYLQLAETDATGHADPVEDTSGWAEASAPFGTLPAASGTGSGALGWPDPATAVPTSVRLWLRREVAAPSGTPLLVRLRYDGAAAVYWNGVLVTDLAETGSLSQTASVAVTAAGGVNTLAVRITDDAGDPVAGDFTYADVSVVAA